MQVEFADILVWLKESGLIFRRRPVVFLVISVAFFVLCHKVRISGYLTFFIALILCQAAVVACIVIARGAHESKTLKQIFWTAGFASVKTTVIII